MRHIENIFQGDVNLDGHLGPSRRARPLRRGFLLRVFWSGGLTPLPAPIHIRVHPWLLLFFQSHTAEIISELFHHEGHEDHEEDRDPRRNPYISNRLCFLNLRFILLSFPALPP